MTELRHAMEYLGDVTGESFITEIQKLDPIGHTFDGARSLMLDLAVHVYKTVEHRSSPASPSSSYSFAPGLSSLYLAVHPPSASRRTIDLTDDVGATATAGDGNVDANVTGENAAEDIDHGGVAEEAPGGNAAEEAPGGNAAEEADVIAAAGEAGVAAGAIEDGSDVGGDGAVQDGGVVNDPEEIIVNNAVGVNVAGGVEGDTSHESSLFSDESSSGSD